MSPHRALAADTALAIVVLLDLLSSGSGAEPPELSNGGPFCDWNLTLRDTNPLVDEADQHYLSLGEASPVIFQTNTEPKTTVLVCRTPKVGSLLVRSLALAYVTGQPYRTLPNTDLRFHTNSSMTIAAKGPEEGYRLLTTNDGVTRIMFARHPVERILVGYLQVFRYPGTDAKIREERFRNWCFAYLRNTYRSNCAPDMQLQSYHWLHQHYLPPQHCRCGLPCGVEWKVFKMEEHGPADVLSRYVPGLQVPPGTGVNSKKYNKEDFLSREVLNFLNRLTKAEQEFFGYAPYRLKG